MITNTIDSYWIQSQNKTKWKLQIHRICLNFNFFNFEKKKLYMWHTFWHMGKVEPVYPPSNSLSRGHNDAQVYWHICYLASMS